LESYLSLNPNIILLLPPSDARREKMRRLQAR
jgi:hypothetical protein